jgi:tetratricopeptide (TPR) repeat protein
MNGLTQIKPAYRSILLLLGLLPCLGLFSQTNTTQQYNSSYYQQNSSVKGKIQNYQAKSLLDMYLDSARYLADKSPLRAVDFINKAIGESINTGNREKEALAFLILGNIQQQLGQHDLAVENYRKSIKRLGDDRKKSSASRGNSSETTLFNACRNAALSLIELNKLDEAQNYCETGINNYSSSISAADILDIKRVLAKVYLKQNKPKESRELLNEVLEKEQSAKNIPGEIQTLIALGKTYQAQDNETTAIEYYTKAKDLSEKHRQNNLNIDANEQLASVYRKQKKIDKEIEARSSNIAINNSTNNYQANTAQNIEIGNAYLNDNQIEKAGGFYDLSSKQVQATTKEETVLEFPTTRLFAASSDLDETANAYKILAKEYVKRKEFDKAAVFFEKYAQLQDSIKKIRKKELDEAIAISTNIGKNQQRVDLLEKERELTEKSIDILEQDKLLREDQLDLKNWIIGSLCAGMLLMLVAVLLIIRSSREKRKAHQLLALKSLRGQMNPHFIFNALNSVNHYVSQNDERRANRYLSDFSRLMRLVMDSSKSDFIAIVEELEMLRLYMQLEHARFEDKFEYSIEVDEKVEEGDWEIPPMLIQPYLENAVWHGLRYIEGKGSLKMSLIHENSALIVTITDTGIGRSKSKELKTMNQKKQNSLGMQNIQSRVEIMNQVFATAIKVEISDAWPGEKNCGTRVKLIIPQKKTSNA